MYTSVNYKGESEPFLPVVCSESKLDMIKFIKRYNNKQRELGRTDSDDIAILEKINYNPSNCCVTPEQYWECN